MAPNFARFSKGYFSPQARYRGRRPFSWLEWTSSLHESVAAIPKNAKRARVRRDGKSLRGIGERQHLRLLVAKGVDQALLDEIGLLSRLERLHLEHPVTASDLKPLTRLPNLKFLSIEYPHRIADFAPLATIASLRTLFLVDARQMQDLAWVAAAKSLRVFGAEGGLWRKQKLASLAPLRELPNLEALFLTGVTLDDRDLDPLADCAALKLLECDAIVPAAEFAKLARLRPDIACDRFDLPTTK